LLVLQKPLSSGRKIVLKTSNCSSPSLRKLFGNWIRLRKEGTAEIAFRDMLKVVYLGLLALDRVRARLKEVYLGLLALDRVRAKIDKH
jgi:hypothetical protein